MSSVFDLKNKIFNKKRSEFFQIFTACNLVFNLTAQYNFAQIRIIITHDVGHLGMIKIGLGNVLSLFWPAARKEGPYDWSTFVSVI